MKRGNQKHNLFVCGVGIGAALFASISVQAQPTLFPVAPPVAPTGRMGPRTEIRTLPYTITLPGSYYLSNNLFGPAPGLVIDANNVTVDLNGFTINGVGAATAGISFGPAAGGYTNVTVHDGMVTGWGGAGLAMTTGSGGGAVTNCHVYNITASGNGGDGINVGSNSIVRDCITVLNLGSGLRTNNYAKITNVVAVSNSGAGISGFGCHISDSVCATNGGAGFGLGGNVTVIGCVAYGNGSQGFTSGVNSRYTDCVAMANGSTTGTSGFEVVGDGSIIGGCAAFNNAASGFNSIPVVGPPPGGNSIHDCISSFNGFVVGVGHGINSFREVQGCTCNGNITNGIMCGYGGHVWRNTCEGNTVNGIAVAGVGANGNLIEYNYVGNNTGAGITTAANPALPGNMVVSNRAHLNGGGNYIFVAGVDTTGALFVGPGVIPAATSVYANIAFP